LKPDHLQNEQNICGAQGIYECTNCDARYTVEDASEDDLICDECGADLDIEGDEDDAVESE
jgi:transcription initiation factor IIE alpha subunit